MKKLFIGMIFILSNSAFSNEYYSRTLNVDCAVKGRMESINSKVENFENILLFNIEVKDVLLNGKIVKREINQSENTPFKIVSVGYKSKSRLESASMRRDGSYVAFPFGLGEEEWSRPRTRIHFDELTLTFDRLSIEKFHNLLEELAGKNLVVPNKAVGSQKLSMRKYKSRYKKVDATNTIQSHYPTNKEDGLSYHLETKCSWE